MEDNVRLIWITPDAEKHIAYCARVSNSQNQDNPEIGKLLNYCFKNKHFSIFEMASMCLEIETSRAIADQIVRHRSFNFQIFSQRYAVVEELLTPEARRQDTKNRQNSIDDLDESTRTWWNDQVNELYSTIQSTYKEALDLGIAKECARMILPMSAKTKMYMSGNIRSWIHYLQVRAADDSGTQLEHYEVALKCKEIFTNALPIISQAIANN